MTVLTVSCELAQGCFTGLHLDHGSGASTAPCTHKLSRKKHKATVKAASLQRSENGTSQVSPTMAECAWRRFLEDSSIWWDNRRLKMKGLALSHASTGEALWIDSQNEPGWRQAELDSLQDCNAPPGPLHNVTEAKCAPGAAENCAASSRGEQWQDLVTGPARWWDDGRSQKLSPKDALWIYRPPWVKEALKKNGVVGESSFQSGIRSGSAGHAVHKWLPEHHHVPWTTLILGYANRGQYREALKIYKEMRENRVKPSTFTFLHALKTCSFLGDLESGKEIHGHIMESGDEIQVFVTNSLIDMYVKCGSMMEAFRVFDNMPMRTTVSWNVMILGYAKKEESELALELYVQMQQEGVQPSERTFVGALKACRCLATLEQGTAVDGKFVKVGCLEKVRAIHSQLVQCGFESNTFVGNMLIETYVKCGSLVDAQHVFDKLLHRDVVSWTTMILGYAEKQESEVALQLYAWMQLEDVEPDNRTFVAALKACSCQAALEEEAQVDGKYVKIWCLEKGRAMHSLLKKQGFESNTFVANTLIDMYTKCGSMMDAGHVFEKLRHRDVISWTAMILGYAKKEEGELALELYAWMLEEGVRPSERTFVVALKACSSVATLEEGTEVEGKFVKLVCLEKGRDIHSQVVKNGFEANVFVGNTLIDMYAKCGSMLDARRVFEKLPHRSVVSWNAIILGHVDNQEGRMALQLFARMEEEGVSPDDRTFVAALKACSVLAVAEEGIQVDGKLVKIWCLVKGRSIHSQVIRNGFHSDMFVGNTLVDMYSKCGSIMDARRVFDALPHRDLVSWNAMISGYAEKQDGALALELYARMQQENVIPDDRTFVGALKACSSLAATEEATEVGGKLVRARCLDMGQAIHSQVVRSGFESNAFVGKALIDMYAKCGNMVDARRVFDKLSHPDVTSWAAVILGYAEQGENEEVIKLFSRMQEHGFSADRWTFVNILKACANAAALELGKEIQT